MLAKLISVTQQAGAACKAIGSCVRKLWGEVFQEELATYLGVSQGQLSKIENGKLPPSLDILIKLSYKFGKSLDWIVKGSES